MYVKRVYVEAKEGKGLWESEAKKNLELIIERVAQQSIIMSSEVVGDGVSRKHILQEWDVSDCTVVFFP